MPVDKQDLIQLEEDISALDEQLKNHCIAWAQDELSKAKEEPTEIIAIQNEIDVLDEKIRRVRELLKNREDGLARKKEIRKSESEGHKAMGDFYQVLGKRSFELYKKGQIQHNVDLDDIFNPLMSYEDKIRTADNELYRIRTSEKSNIFDKMGSLLKKSTQTSKKKNAGDGLSKQYKKTGEALIKEGFFNDIAQSGLSDIYDEFQVKEERNRQFTDELEQLETQRVEIEKELNEITQNAGASKGLRSYEKDLEEAEEKLDDALLRFGQELYGREAKGKEPFRDLIDELNVKREAKLNRKLSLLTEIRLDEIKSDIDKIERDIQAQQERVGREQEKLDSLLEEKKNTDTKRDKLESELKELNDSMNQS